MCYAQLFSPVWVFVTTWTVAGHIPVSTGILQVRTLECVSMSSSRDLPNPGIEPRFPTLQVDSLLSEPPGKSKNTGVGSLSILQGIFPIQKSNQSLLHCRQILYQLSYQGSPEPQHVACWELTSGHQPRNTHTEDSSMCMKDTSSTVTTRGLAECF